MAHFLAQTAVEKGGFKRLKEDIRYSAKRLMAMWPSSFPTAARVMAVAERVDNGSKRTLRHCRLRTRREIAAKVDDGMKAGPD